jgi:hypothetical protein
MEKLLLPDYEASMSALPPEARALAKGRGLGVCGNKSCVKPLTGRCIAILFPFLPGMVIIHWECAPDKWKLEVLESALPAFSPEAFERWKKKYEGKG